jgi:hypothetical protein
MPLVKNKDLDSARSDRYPEQGFVLCKANALKGFGIKH